MKPRYSHSPAAFTITETMVVAAVTVIIAMGILTYATMSMRMIYRNLTVNHGHDAARAAWRAHALRPCTVRASQLTLYQRQHVGNSDHLQRCHAHLYKHQRHGLYIMSVLADQ